MHLENFSKKELNIISALVVFGASITSTQAANLAISDEIRLIEELSKIEDEDIDEDISKIIDVALNFKDCIKSNI